MDLFVLMRSDNTPYNYNYPLMTSRRLKKTTHYRLSMAFKSLLCVLNFPIWYAGFIDGLEAAF